MTLVESAARARRGFRLPAHVWPVGYDVFLSVDLERRRFDGRAAIDIEVRRGTRELMLHAVGLALKSVVVTAGRRRFVPEVERLLDEEAILLRLPAPLRKGVALLEIEWAGVMNAGVRGLYREGDVVATQFQPADARRVFPCFDEPEFKAPWRIALDRYFGVPFGFDKLDLVAVPALGPGAMENAGLVTFRESVLLVDPAQASLATMK